MMKFNNKVLFIGFLIVITSCLAACRDENVTTKRDKAVKEAWKQEREVVMAGKKPSRNWAKEELIELKETGKVRGYEGHHINDVSNHPKLSGVPDNIKFVKGRAQHLEEHGGNFRNPTEGPLIKRDPALGAYDYNLNWIGKALLTLGASLVTLLQGTAFGGFLLSFFCAIGSFVLGILGIATPEPFVTTGLGFILCLIGIAMIFALCVIIF
jgi:hypothetical protein